MPDRSVPRICLGLLALAALPLQAAVPATSAAPAFCASPSGQAERAICADAVLRTADREVARTYAAALDKASRRERHLLRKEQQGWWAGVNDCAKTDDVHACVTAAYDTRKVELQATSHLVAARGPFVFSCTDGSRLHVTYHATEPASMVALRGDVLGTPGQRRRHLGDDRAAVQGAVASANVTGTLHYSWRNQVCERPSIGTPT